MSDLVCDVLVIGGGHAGCESAWASANIGARTVLVTHDLDALGRPSCNPAVGGLGKGQMVREVDALGGLIGRVTDEAGIQFRMLNRRKGPAVWGPRAQIDSAHYSAVLRRYLENCPNLSLLSGSVDAISTEPLQDGRSVRRITGVALEDGRTIAAAAVVLAAGTFLRGLMHTGEDRTPGGRIGEPSANRLSDALRSLGLRLERLKTGTPPRIARDSVDFSQLRPQYGDEPAYPFSFMTDRIDRPQVCCWHAATNEHIHELIRANLARAPLYTGQIDSTGPRYCPSIETKVVRFPDKAWHQLFLEPEGRDSDRMYVNGISTSLPTDIQAQIVAGIPGLEHARIIQWGYAIEYDFAPPDQIHATLQTRHVAGLFLAGQVNGTSGYEEAAGQGLLAGVNAARHVGGQELVTLERDQAYIGVMIDDLVTRGVTEPYRMFTSRAEHRMHLRYDNAAERLTALGRAWGTVDDARWNRYQSDKAAVESLRSAFRQHRVEGISVHDWLKRPEEDGARFRDDVPELRALATDRRIWDRAVISVKYSGYIDRQAKSIERFRELEDRSIPPDIVYEQIPHLRREAMERLTAVRPRSVGQAARISGIHPTDITTLLVALARSRR